MSVLTSQLIISLIDRVTEPARQAAGSLAGITHRIREANGQRLGLSDRLDLALSRNADALDRARLGVIDVAGSYATLHGAIAGPIQTAAEFEAAMASVAKVVDFPTPEAFEAFQNELFRLSREIPFAVNGLAEIAAAAGQAGIAGADLTRFTAAAAKIGVAFDISSEQSGTAMANMMTALGLSVDEAILLADAMNHLSNSQASSAADILSVVQSVGAQATMFGFTAEQTAAFASAMLAAGAQSDVAATSFRNMGAALTRGASATGSQRDALQALGLDAEQVARSMQENAVATTTDVLRRIAQLPAEQQAAISTDLFGSEARALGPLLTNLDLIEGTLAMVGDQSRYAGSAFAEFAAQNDTFNSHLQRFLSLLDEFKIRIGNALIPALVRLGQAIAPIIVAASEFAASYPEVTTAIVGSIAGFIALKGALAGLTFVGLLGRGGALNLLAAGFRSLFLVARAGPLLAVGAALSFLSNNWEGVKAGIDAFKASFSEAMSAASPALERFTALVGDALSWFNRLTGPIDPDLWLRWGSAAATAAAGVVAGLARAASGLRDFLSNLAVDPQAALAQARSAGKQIVDSLMDGLSEGWSRVTSWSAGLDLDLRGLAAGAGRSIGALSADLANAAIVALRSAWASITSYAGDLDWGRVGATVASGLLAGWSGLGELVIAAISYSWSSLATFVDGLDVDWSQAAANILLGVPQVAYGLGAALVQAMAGAYSAVHDWASTVTVDWGAVGETIGAGVGRLIGVVGGFLYETFTEIWTGVAAWLASDGPGVDWGGAASSIVDAVFDGIGAAWHAYSNFVMGLLRGLFGEIPPEVFEAGATLIQLLKDGAVQAFDDFLGWVAGIPGRILSAIGRIDLSSLIDFGEPPGWLKWLIGEDESAAQIQAVPAPPSQSELGALDIGQRAAAEALMTARSAGDVPTQQYLDDLSTYAGQLRDEMAGVQAQIAQIDQNGPMGQTLAVPLRAELRHLQSDLYQVEGDLAEGRSRADEVTHALRMLGDTSATPEVSTASIDAALARARALSMELGGLNRPGATTGAAPAPAVPEIDGQRAKGGPISRGGTYLVGEDGPELITASRNGYVHPNGEGPVASEAAAASSLASITVTVGDIVISPTISTTERVDPAQLSREIGRQMRDEVREAFRGVFADTGMRFA
ncbi:MAG: phage tail tape measure protein [Marivita sp.]|uniref:phage tail tape measure protein n=1 Tax=Marivita sp. TaxID=2003365 RepID=UPI001B05056C|nr:phage tail tape measure protein [Marivita sp.]MBO6885980.1 phage tail tape measure protein [Marivita sp.]